MQGGRRKQRAERPGVRSAQVGPKAEDAGSGEGVGGGRALKEARRRHQRQWPIRNLAKQEWDDGGASPPDERAAAVAGLQ